MGLNISEGLNRLGEGLGNLYNHSIYKDERARQQRLDAAKEQFQNWQMKMQEEQFGFTKEQAGLEADFRDRQTEFMNEVTTTQLDQGERRLDIAEEGVDVRREATQAELGQGERRLDILERAQTFREEQAERQAEIQQSGNKIEIYTSTMERTTSRANELRDALREEIGNAAVSPEDQTERQKLILDELKKLKIAETRAALAADVVSLDQYAPEDQETIMNIMEANDVDQAAAIVGFMEGEYGMMDEEEVRRRVEEARAAGTDPMAEGLPPEEEADPGYQDTDYADTGSNDFIDTGESYRASSYPGAGIDTPENMSRVTSNVYDWMEWMNQTFIAEPMQRAGERRAQSQQEVGAVTQGSR